MKKSLVVLAAGMGSRYGGLKQMDPVGPGGAFIIDYTVFDAIRAGFDRIVFVIRKDIEEAFRETIVSRIAPHVETQCVFQELDALPSGFSVPPDRTKPWGTGHALLVADGAVADPFGVVTADDFYGRDSFGQLAAFLDASHDESTAHGMVGFVLRNTLSPHGSVSRGICEVNGQGMLVSLTERTAIELREDETVHCDEQALTGEELASMSMYGFQPSLFSHLRSQFSDFLDASGTEMKSEFFLPDVVNRLLREGEATMQVMPTRSSWVGVTHPGDRPQVVAALSKLVAEGEYPEQLW